VLFRVSQNLLEHFWSILETWMKDVKKRQTDAWDDASIIKS